MDRVKSRGLSTGAVARELGRETCRALETDIPPTIISTVAPGRPVLKPGSGKYVRRAQCGSVWKTDARLRLISLTTAFGRQGNLSGGAE